MADLKAWSHGERKANQIKILIKVLMKQSFVQHFVDGIAKISYDDSVTPLGEFF